MEVRHKANIEKGKLALASLVIEDAISTASSDSKFQNLSLLTLTLA